MSDKTELFHLALDKLEEVKVLLLQASEQNLAQRAVMLSIDITRDLGSLLVDQVRKERSSNA